MVHKGGLVVLFRVVRQWRIGVGAARSARYNFEVWNMTRRLTKSEAVFEEFLRSHDLSFERVLEAATPRPDYTVNIDGLQLMFELKELSEDIKFDQSSSGSSSRIVGAYIRHKISQAR